MRTLHSVNYLVTQSKCLYQFKMLDIRTVLKFSLVQQSFYLVSADTNWSIQEETEEENAFVFKSLKSYTDSRIESVWFLFIETTIDVQSHLLSQQGDPKMCVMKK